MKNSMRFNKRLVNKRGYPVIRGEKDAKTATADAKSAVEGRFNNEQKYKVGLVIYQPIPDFTVIFFYYRFYGRFG